MVEQFGGPATPAVGFGMGLERLVLILLEKGFHVEHAAEVSVVYDEVATGQAFALAHILRGTGFRADITLQPKNMKNQFKRADKVGSRVTLILGAQELQKNTVMFKDMKSQEQKEIKIDDINNELNKLLRQ
jgi:histidyl-tRNA synthetase